MFNFKKKIVALVVVFISLIVFRAQIAEAVEMITGCPNITDNGVTLFEGKYCSGDRVNFNTPGQYSLNDISFGWKTSSDYIKWGWSVKLMNNTQYICHNWAAWNFEQDTWQDGWPLDNTATDIIVYDSPNCSRETRTPTPTSTPTPIPQPAGCPYITDNGVTLFADSYCSGESKNFNTPGVYYLPEFSFSEVASSAFVQNGWSVKFYADNVDYCKNWSAWNFGIDTWSDGSSMNDRIKSIQVYNQSDCGETSTPEPTPTPVPTADETKLLVVNFIPDNVTPTYNPTDLTNEIIPVMNEVTSGEVDYKVVDEQTVNRSTTKKSDGRMDYNALITEFDVCNRLNTDEIDEVWVWVNDGDGAGWEWLISGDYNYPEVINPCGQSFIVMGFDYTRTYDLALHSLGHRMEYISNRAQGFDYYYWEQKCGNVHFPPNGVQDYDYSNISNVENQCNDTPEILTCSVWGCNQEGYMKWWFSNIPQEWWDSFLSSS